MSHRRYYKDSLLLYLFSVNVELGMAIEQIGLVPGGARANVYAVPTTSRVYNVLRQRMVALDGYPTVTGTILWGEDAGVFREDDVAIANVRATIETDDGAIIDTVYRGVLPLGAGAFRGILSGADSLGTAEEPVSLPIVVTPRYETASAKYRWLTEQQCVGFGRVEAIDGVFRRVSYDIFAMA